MPSWSITVVFGLDWDMRWKSRLCRWGCECGCEEREHIQQHSHPHPPFYRMKSYVEFIAIRHWSRAVLLMTGLLCNYIDPLYKWLQMWTHCVTSGSVYCNTSTMYQCMDSPKCISKARLFDHVQDYLHNDDEDRSNLNKTCPFEPNANIFQCRTTDECIPFLLVGDSEWDCTKDESGRCDDKDSESIDVTATLLFPTTCDGFPHRIPVQIEGEMHTDETNCEQWSCNNVYTRCNIFWNCPDADGIDELNCYKFPRLECPPNHHVCASFDTQQMMCLPIEKANDGHVDCVGDADEPALGEHLVSQILKSWHVQARSIKDLIKKICLETSWLDQIHLYTRSWKDLSKIWRSWKDYESQWSLPKILNETDSDTTSEQISKLFRIPWLFNRNILK